MAAILDEAGNPLLDEAGAAVLDEAAAGPGVLTATVYAPAIESLTSSGR